ncbi:hypothetical protein L1987_40616 [Smallanthus sonchifolius]|uniref:Uncharacterized protein n=1 Tax=Smallanthus sonchifolius TaxID=185202 RepID=A0ACB9GT80_9ASTR|nr:hypothetical protein L1987_40616 [Smallanthus sonchifolius]
METDSVACTETNCLVAKSDPVGAKLGYVEVPAKALIVKTYAQVVDPGLKWSDTVIGGELFASKSFGLNPTLVSDRLEFRKKVLGMCTLDTSVVNGFGLLSLRLFHVLSFKRMMRRKLGLLNSSQFPIHFFPDERMLWIEIMGLPMAAWDSRCVKTIASLLGECIFVYEDKGKPMAYSKVCILSSSKKQS